MRLFAHVNPLFHYPAFAIPPALTELDAEELVAEMENRAKAARVPAVDPRLAERSPGRVRKGTGGAVSSLSDRTIDARGPQTG